MIQNYLKITIRNILRHKGYSFINLAGLSVGFVCFILILLYVKHEFDYDGRHALGDRIYRINVTQKHPNREFTTYASMAPLGPAARAEIPEVEDFTRLFGTGKILVKFGNESFYENNAVFTDPGIFTMFDVPLKMGNPATALSDKFSVVITEEIAHKYFQGENPIGKLIQIEDDKNYKISAVCQNFPENTSINPDIMISFSTLEDLAGENFMHNWITTNMTTYIMATDNDLADVIGPKINTVMNMHSKAEVERSLQLEKFSRIYLYSELSGSGKIKYVYIFLTIGFLILLIAGINFMNLSTARSVNRSKEVGLRKVVGASRNQLIGQFFGESLIMSLLSLVVAIMIVANMLPAYEQITNQTIQLPGAADWYLYLFLFLIGLVVGIFAGSYPAMVLSSFSPVSVIKHSGKSGKGRSIFRKVLVFVQFGFAIILVICTLIVSDQLSFLANKDLGFKKDQIVVIPVQGIDYTTKLEPFKNNILQQANITGATVSMLLPSRIGFYNNVTWEGAQEGESIAMIQNKVDYDFLDTYEIKLIRGRNFSKEFSTDLLDYNREQAGAALINEEAVRRFGWTDPIGKKIIQTYGQQRSYFDVVGVFNDFHFASLHNEIQPLYLMLLPRVARYISIKIRPENIEQTVASIEKTWKEVLPGFPFEYSFLDESFANFYRSEANLRKLFNYFALLTIFISCLGLFGLSSFSAEQRTKEIGVRKALGASVPGLAVMMGLELTRWVALANLIAWPVAWYIMSQWLGNFAYKTTIHWWMFILAGFIALIIALATVSWQAIRAALANPIEALRYE